MSDQGFPVTVAVERDGRTEQVRVGTAFRNGEGFTLRLGELSVGARGWRTRRVDIVNRWLTGRPEITLEPPADSGEEAEQEYDGTPGTALHGNPMYLGHLIFLAGLAFALDSWLAAALFVFHAAWFDRRVRDDEARLIALFGDPYRAYLARVKRWIPGIH